MRAVERISGMVGFGTCVGVSDALARAKCSPAQL